MANNPANNPVKFEAEGDLAGYRMLSRHEVLALTNLSYPTLWKMMRGGTFPRSRQCGGRVLWLTREIKDWLDKRPVATLKGDKKAVNA